MSANRITKPLQTVLLRRGTEPQENPQNVITLFTPFLGTHAGAQWFGLDSV